METSEQHQNYVLCWLKTIASSINYTLGVFYTRLNLIEQFFIKMHNIFAFISQIFFFTLCSTLLDEGAIDFNPNDQYLVMALKTILFYSVFTYFVAKTRDIYSTRQPRFQNYSFVENCCKIVLEWAKAIIVVLCLRDQGISFNPTPFYATVTAIYYVCSERIYLDIATNFFQLFEANVLENLEHLYVPLLFNVYLVAAAAIAEVYFVMHSDYRMFAMSSFYFLLYLRIKDVYYNCWRLIRLEKSTFESFRNATNLELENFDDVCAVCLNRMSKAKITPCNHYFHPYCLKQCLKTSFLCPICKLKFE